jgi:DNA polymerase III gamma/tau subunit
MIYDNLIVNEKIWSQLNAMVENQKLPHAMLFHGPHGTGKEAHAIKLAALLNDDTENSQLVKIKNFQHPNINLILPMPREKTINKKSNALDCLSEKSLEHLIEMKKQKMVSPYYTISFSKASSILINSIRDIKKNSHFDINKGAVVHIIFEAEKLCSPKTEPGNALLKILEEPPKNTFFILITSNKDKILDTIISRCCDFYFPKINNQKIKNYFNQNMNIENLDLLINITHGSMKELYQIIESEIDIHTLIEDAKNIIGVLMKNDNWETHYKNLEKLFKSDRHTFTIFIKILIFVLNDLEKIKNNNFDCLILEDIKKTKKLDYSACIEIVETTYQNLYKNLNPSIGIASMLIKMKKILR